MMPASTLSDRALEIKDWSATVHVSNTAADLAEADV